MIPRLGQLRRAASLTLALAAAAALPARAGAQCTVTTNTLPPQNFDCAYIAQIEASFGGGAVQFFGTAHSQFNIISITNVGADQEELFKSIIDGAHRVGAVVHHDHFTDVQVKTKVFDRAIRSLGTFNTEMLMLDVFDGGVPLLRESPTLTSPGVTDVADNGNGTFTISSFFDIFLELSPDGGQTWIPADGPTHVTLATIPEPATVALTMSGLLALGVLRRRRNA
jgi:hypothetical protein